MDFFDLVGTETAEEKSTRQTKLFKEKWAQIKADLMDGQPAKCSKKVLLPVLRDVNLDVTAADIIGVQPMLKAND